MQYRKMSIVAILLLAGSIAGAQNVEIGISGSAAPDQVLPDKVRAGDSVVLVLGLEAEETISGFQFDVKYDPARFRVTDLSNCLAGLPATHQGEFSVCNDVPEKGLVRVVVLDLGRNRVLNVSDSLGVIEFSARSAVQSAIGKKLPRIDNVMLAGLDGKELKNRMTAEAIVSKVSIR